MRVLLVLAWLCCSVNVSFAQSSDNLTLVGLGLPANIFLTPTITDESLDTFKKAVGKYIPMANEAGLFGRVLSFVIFDSTGKPTFYFTKQYPHHIFKKYIDDRIPLLRAEPNKTCGAQHVCIVSVSIFYILKDSAGYSKCNDDNNYSKIDINFDVIESQVVIKGCANPSLSLTYANKDFKKLKKIDQAIAELNLKIDKKYEEVERLNEIKKKIKPIKIVKGGVEIDPKKYSPD